MCINKKNILLAWEWGEGLGHLSNLLFVAESLRESGCEVVVAVRDKVAASKLIRDPNIKLIQAPAWRRRARSIVHDVSSFSTVLYNFGFTDLACLYDCVSGWKRVLQNYQPQIVVCEFAPGLQVAAYGLGIDTVAVGSSFAEPDPSRYGLKITGETEKPEDIDLHMAVQDNINRVLSRLKMATLESLDELFRVKGTLLTTLPEIDVYQRRVDGDYLGPLSMTLGESEIRWTEHDKPKVLAYVKPDSMFFEALMLMLSRSGCNVIAYVPKSDKRVAASEYVSDTMKVFSSPVDVVSLIEGADIVVHHGGNGLLCQTLLKGKPQLLAPNHQEQQLNAFKLQDLGAGSVVENADLEECEESFKRLLADVSYSESAQGIASRYSFITQDWQREKVRSVFSQN
ncbi:glycosyltransferase [Hahella aquimaris]|uniref:glycosyltransferase n=1 Tax=Hahella sp. HNIBRBA332 TaxID=3015983 RepID=UPI00273AFED9|nr:nucleotide disphospho-sugar-binding domain-containing protein [Hahella sp. HNIBRBA332]WLQ11597.1 glycosyltransferase [Hahella sp. HNIBRBA332]